MKKIRLFSLLATLATVAALFAGCTGDVPEPYGESEVLAECVVSTKIVVQEESESGEVVDNVIFEQDVTVTSYTKPALSIKDLVNTLDELNLIPAKMRYNNITSFSTYEANDTHMWFWSLNDKGDVPIASALNATKDKDGNIIKDTVVFTYAEKSAEIATDDEGNVLATTVKLKVQASDAVLYDNSVTIEGETSVSVKNVLKYLRDEEGALTVSVAGSIKSINDYKAEGGYVWNTYVDDEIVKPSEKVKDGTEILIRYEQEA